MQNAPVNGINLFPAAKLIGSIVFLVTAHLKFLPQRYFSTNFVRRQQIELRGMKVTQFFTRQFNVENLRSHQKRGGKCSAQDKEASLKMDEDTLEKRRRV